VPRLPPLTPVSVTPRLAIGRLRGVLERDLIAQSAAERLVKALFAAGLLWLLIWWALS
jgi:hypothetical protein